MTWFAYETVFWQCSTEDYAKSFFKAILLMIKYTVGAAFFNLFAAAELSVNVCVAHGTYAMIQVSTLLLL